MTESWQDRTVGARMATDRAFADRVEASSFSRQQWGLVMTATDFEIENPDDEEAARIVANTDHLDTILPELDSIEQQMQTMSAGGPSNSSGGGILGGIKDALGLGNGAQGVDESRRQEATTLVQEYADEFQRYLEDNDRWDEIREIAAAEE